MLTNFFGKSKPINTVVLTGLFLIMFFLAVFTEKTIFNWLVIPLYVFVFGLVIFVNSKNKLTFDNSYTFLSFILLLSLFPIVISTGNVIYANLVVLLFLRKVYSLKSEKNIFVKLFDAGFWLGVSFLIEPYTVVFFVLLYASIFLHKRLTIHTLLIPVIGFFIPLLFYFSYCYWYEKVDRFNVLFYWHSTYNATVYINNYSLYSLYFVGLFLLASVLLKTPKTLSVKTTFRKNWILILLNLTISIIILFLSKNNEGTELMYAFFPIAVILANGLELIKKKWIGDFLIISFLIVALFAIIL